MADQERARGWRLRLGAAIFVLSFFSPALIPLVTGSGLSMEWKTAFAGLLAFGIPELGAIIAVAIMGKTGFEMIKSRFLAGLRHFRPAERVSPTRYRISPPLFRRSRNLPPQNDTTVLRVLPGMDSPESRLMQLPAPKVVQFPEVGVLHHHFERVAA